MRRHNISHAFSALFLTVCLGMYLAPGHANEREHAQALEQVRSKIEQLRKEIEKTQTQHDAVSTELRHIERDISKLHRTLKQLGRKLGKQEQELRKLRQERQALQAEMATHHRLLTRQVQAAYMIGQQEYLKLLLNQQDPAVVGRTMTYYDYFNRARLTRIDAARQTLTQLVAVEDKIQQQTRALGEVQAQQLAKREALQAASRSRAQVVTRLRQELSSQTQEMARLVEDEKRLQDLVTRLKRVIPDILTAPGSRKRFAELRGKLTWPTQGKLQALYGQRREGGRLKWNGVLIEADEGRDVRAVSGGRVAYADWLRGYGLLLILDHGDGYMSLYGHNQAIYRETGEWVEAGEPIASVGRSGGQKDAALYFEIRHNGKPVNPQTWCRRG